MKVELSEYAPKSSLHASETKISRSRFPAIDFHTHLTWGAFDEEGKPTDDYWGNCGSPSEMISVMERMNIRAMVNITGGTGACLDATIRKYQSPHPDRFFVFTEPWWTRVSAPDYSRFQAEEIIRARGAGAYGLKIQKILGLFVQEDIVNGPLIRIDDCRFDPMWEVCGSLNMPVAIHVSDPDAFFMPVDASNERLDELANRPDWSYYGRGFPSKADLLEARNRVFARHPRTQFVAEHVGNNAENLEYVSDCLSRFPNMHVDIAGQIAELGRQPRAARKFFDKYQDRILFGTDLMPPWIPAERIYEIYFRFLETEDEYFDYAPTPIPPQGRWRIYGVGLSEEVLRKVYLENATRLLDLTKCPCG